MSGSCFVRRSALPADGVVMFLSGLTPNGEPEGTVQAKEIHDSTGWTGGVVRERGQNFELGHVE